MDSLVLIDCDALLYKGYEDLDKYKDRIDEIISEIVVKAEATHYRCFIEDFGNQTFRSVMYSDYKDKRKDKPKPVNYKEIKEYILINYNPYVSKGVETDDSIISTRSYVKRKHPDCFVQIAANDKDYLTYPVNYIDLYHGRYLQKQTISEKNAMYNLAYQMLAGDTVDSVKGIPGMGEAKTNALLKGVKQTRMHYVKAVLSAYKRYYGRNYKTYIEKNYRLLRLREDVKPCKAFEKVEFE